MAFAICAGDYACGCVNAQLVVDIVEYETDALPVQRLNLRGCGGGRLGDQASVPRWGGGRRFSVFCLERL